MKIHKSSDVQRSKIGKDCNICANCFIENKFFIKLNHNKN